MSKRREIREIYKSKPYIAGNGYIIRSQRDTPTPKLPLSYTKRVRPLEDCLKSSILIWINTFERADSLKLLLDDIKKNLANFKVKILVIDDFSEIDYTTMLKQFQDQLNITYHKVNFNHGKQLYWRLCNYALSLIKEEAHSFDYFIKIDDDCRLVNNFLIKCVNIWETILDLQKISLNFLLDNREGKPVWTKTLPRKILFKNLSLYLSQWVDMNFFCERSMFEVLNYNISKQPEIRWKADPKASSGVGQDISSRLSRKHHLYMTTETLVIHGECESRMNREERNRHPLTSKPITNLNYGMPV